MGFILAVDGKEREVSYKEWNDLLQQNFERLYYVPADPSLDAKYDVDPSLVARRGVYKDVHGTPAPRSRADYQLRGNFPIAMAVAPELFTPKFALDALAVLEANLVGPLGVKTLDPADPDYRRELLPCDSRRFAPSDRLTSQLTTTTRTTRTTGTSPRAATTTKDRSGCGRWVRFTKLSYPLSLADLVSLQATSFALISSSTRSPVPVAPTPPRPSTTSTKSFRDTALTSRTTRGPASPSSRTRTAATATTAAARRPGRAVLCSTRSMTWRSWQRERRLATRRRRQHVDTHA